MLEKVHLDILLWLGVVNYIDCMVLEFTHQFPVSFHKFSSAMFMLFLLLS